MILITTYNRPKMLARLLEDIRSETDQRIVIANDGSTKDYSEPYKLLGKYDKVLTLKQNHGKKWYWKVIDRLFDELKREPFQYVFKLDDDLRLKEGALSEAVSIFEAIGDQDKRALNLLADSRAGKPSWTGIKSEIIGVGEHEVWKAGWVDMIWLANRKFFDDLKYRIWPIPLDRWEDNPRKSSQVGKQISIRLEGKGFYQVCDTLVYHGNHESKMNPLERTINPLTTEGQQ